VPTLSSLCGAQSAAVAEPDTAWIVGTTGGALSHLTCRTINPQRRYRQAAACTMGAYCAPKNPHRQRFTHPSPHQWRLETASVVIRLPDPWLMTPGAHPSGTHDPNYPKLSFLAVNR
jgi:hypothetical protein